MTTGNEAFEIAAAVAAILGLGVSFILALMAALFVWRLFRQASDASMSATRALLAIEDLGRRLGNQWAAPGASAENGRFAELRRQAEALVQQQNQLQQMVRDMLEAEPAEGGVATGGIQEMELAIGRLDTTVGQMAAALANLVQLLERQQGA